MSPVSSADDRPGASRNFRQKHVVSFSDLAVLFALLLSGSFLAEQECSSFLARRGSEQIASQVPGLAGLSPKGEVLLRRPPEGTRGFLVFLLSRADRLDVQIAQWNESAARLKTIGVRPVGFCSDQSCTDSLRQFKGKIDFDALVYGQVATLRVLSETSSHGQVLIVDTRGQIRGTLPAAAEALNIASVDSILKSKI